MKKLFVLLTAVVLIFALGSCGKKKEKEAKEKARIEKNKVLKTLMSKKVDKTFVVDYVAAKKENCFGEIEIATIPKGSKIVYVHEGEKVEHTLKGFKVGIKEGNKIQLENGSVEIKGFKPIIETIEITRGQDTWTKAELMPWIKNHELGVRAILDGKFYLPVDHSFEAFIETAEDGDVLELTEGPTVFVKYKGNYWLFNSKYELWRTREESEALRKK